MDQATKTLVYEVVSQIPPGQALTYKKVAELAGVKSPRLVGKILHANPNPEHIPCHRVVNSQGKVAKNYAFGGSMAQIKKLRQEGVEVSGGTVDLSRYLWYKEVDR